MKTPLRDLKDRQDLLNQMPEAERRAYRRFVRILQVLTVVAFFAGVAAYLVFHRPYFAVLGLVVMGVSQFLIFRREGRN